ncbi:MAG TPA: 3'-5' exonuclease [bacterium]
MAGLVSRIRGLLSGEAVVDAGLPLERIPFAVVDTELTGLDEKRDSVVSVGAVKMSGTRIELGRTFYQLVSPRADFKRESVVVHGITPDDVAQKPPLDAVAADLLAFCGDRVLAGHFLALDLGFLGRECPSIRAADWRRRAVDTMRLHQWLASQRHAGDFSPQGEELNLDAVARRRGIRPAGAHNALADAFTTAQLLQRLLRALPDHGVRTLGDLLRVGRP